MLMEMAKVTGVSRETISKVMTSYDKEERVFSPKQNFRRDRKLSESDGTVLVRNAIKHTKSRNPKLQ